MAIKGYNESSLSSSEIFNGMNSLSGVDTKARAIELIKSAKHLSSADIENAYILMKRLNDGLSMESIKAFDNGSIVLVYNDDPAKSVTQALPFITAKSSKGIITYIFVDKYITVSRDGLMNMQGPILRDLLSGALISNALKNNYMLLQTNQFIQITLCDIYTKFIIRILNRDYSISIDKVLDETIKYYIGMFFYEQIIGLSLEKELLTGMIMKNMKYVDDIQVADMTEKYTKAAPTLISELLELIKEENARMRSLTLQTFISSWINYYYPPSMLAIDNIEYLIFMVLAILGSNNIISIASSDIVKDVKNINRFKEELIKIVN